MAIFFNDTGQVISSLRNSTLSFENNPLHVQESIAKGFISEEGLNVSPPAIQKIAGAQPVTGLTKLGIGAPTKRFQPSVGLKDFVPDPEFFPTANKISTQGSGYHLTRNITIATFSGSNHAPVDFDQVEEPMVVAKNLYLQACILSAASSRKEFQGYRILVEEGLYNYADVETRIEGDLADLSSKGRAIAYNVVTHEGVFYSKSKVFQLAQYLLHYPFYDKLILDWHTYTGALGVRLFVVTPDISNGTEGVVFKRETETRFNNKVMSGSLCLLGTNIGGTSTTESI